MKIRLSQKYTKEDRILLSSSVLAPTIYLSPIPLYLIAP